MTRRITTSRALLLLVILIFVLAFFGAGPEPERLWVLGLAIWAGSQLLED